MTRVIDAVRHGTSVVMEYRDASVVIIDALHTVPPVLCGDDCKMVWFWGVVHGPCNTYTHDDACVLWWTVVFNVVCGLCNVIGQP